MKVGVENQPFLFLTDNSEEASEQSAFVITEQNKKYRNNALKRGCKNILSVDECRKILNISPKLKIVGITGTNGKTTTAAAIYSILLDLGKKVAMQGTRGCFINDEMADKKSLTTPPILQTLSNMQKACEQKCDYFIMEVSSHAIAQERIEGLDFALKIFTNISQDHFDFHHNMQEYARVKSSFFEDESPKLINKDDKNIRYNIKNALTYGIENNATYQIAAFSFKNGIEAAVEFLREIYPMESSLRGLFNLYNLLAAVSAVHILEKIDLKKICEAVENFAGVSGRMEIINSNPLVIIDFAHTPDGIEKVLEAVKDKRLSVVFGAGGNRDKTKRPLMGKIVSHYAKKIYITSDNPRDEEPEDIIEDILSGIEKKDGVFTIVDRMEATKAAIENLQADEVLLILGKGDETYQEIKGTQHHYSDKETAQFFLKEKIDKIRE